MKPQRTGSWLWAGLVWVGFCLASLTWVPLISGGGIDLELSDLTQLGFIMLLPLLMVCSRRASPIHMLFSLMVAWSLVVLLAMALHGTLAGGTQIVRQQLAEALFGWSLALCIANSSVNLGRIALVALLLLIAMLEYSASIAGKSLTIGAIDFIQNLDRDQFIYQVIRPALNAFTNQDDLVFLASEINIVASAIVLFACVTFLRGPNQQGRAEILFRNIVASLSLLLAFIIFSTSAVIVIAVLILAALFMAVARFPPQMRLLAGLFSAAIVILLFGPVSQFLTFNIDQDEASRGARLEQYEYAAGAINSHLLGGEGFSRATGYIIHNWALFSWATGGVLPFCLVLVIYFVILSISIDVVRSTPRELPVVLALLSGFLVKTNVAGAGGIAVDSSILAAALLSGLLVRHRGNAFHRADMAGKTPEEAPQPYRQAG